MSEFKDSIQPESYDDFELVIDYLNRQLDPEKVKLVEQRLADDPRFRELAAPMMLVWRVPTRLQRHPRPAGELERHWDEFTKRAGFVHQKRKSRARLLWVIGLAGLILGLSGLSLRHRIADAYKDARDYEPVVARDAVVDLPNTGRIELTAGSSLRRQVRDTVPDVDRLKLRGSARVLVLRAPAKGFVPSMRAVVIQAANADVSTGNAEFLIAVHGDTTDVTVLNRKRLDQPKDVFDQFADMVLVVSHDFPLRHEQLQEGDRARIVAGSPVRKIAAPARSQ